MNIYSNLCSYFYCIPVPIQLPTSTPICIHTVAYVLS